MYEKEQEEKEQKQLEEEARLRAQKEKEDELKARISGHGDAVHKFFFPNPILVKPESIKYVCGGSRSDGDSVFDLTEANRKILIDGKWKLTNIYSENPDRGPESQDEWKNTFITFETCSVDSPPRLQQIHINGPYSGSIFCTLSISDSLMNQLEQFLTRQGDQNWDLELNLCDEFRVFTPSGFFGVVLEYRLRESQ